MVLVPASPKARAAFTTFAWAGATGLCLLSCSAGYAQNSDNALTVPVSPQVWSTFKGDLQRTGASAAKIAAPMSLSWRFSTDAPPAPLVTSPVVAGPPGMRLVMFATGQYVYCVDGQTGEQKWRADLKKTIKAPLTVVSGGENGDVLIAATSTGLISALRLTSGEALWTADVRTSVQSIAPVPGPTPKGPQLLAAIGTGHIVAINPQSGEIDPDFDIKIGRSMETPATTPVVNQDGTQLYIIGRDQTLASYDLRDQSLVFSKKLTSPTSVTPALVGKTLVCAVETRLLGFDGDDGQISWQANLDGRITSSPSGQAEKNGVNGTLYAGTSTGSLYAVDLSDGTVRWQTPLEVTITGVPLVLPDIIIVGTRNGLLCALRRSDGVVLWRYRLHTERKVTVNASETTAGNNNNNNNGRNGRRGGGGGAAGGIGGVGGAGGGIGGRGGFGRGAAAQMTEVIRTYPISSSPAAVDGQLYVLGDNAALYSFNNDSIDAEPPRALNQALVLRNSDGNLMPVPLTPTGRRTSTTFPGRSPISLTLEVDDPGSGVDPGGFQITLNGEDIPASNIIFQPATGKLTILLAKNDEDGKSTTMEDGLYRVGIIARDFKGNAMTNVSTTFTIDKSAAAPPPTPIGGGRGGFGGRGGRGGGGAGFPGGPGGGFPGGGPGGPGGGPPGLPF